MKIKTITCHEVYNYGASLQEYALLKFLNQQGWQASVLHYKPPYLSGHFNLWSVSPRFDKPLLKQLYLAAKLPSRLKALKKKKAFDLFHQKYIPTDPKLYKNNQELKADLPEGDVFICGSDQIWNSFFENGKNPAFYLNFVPEDKKKISYAASFAIDELEESVKSLVKENVENRINTTGEIKQVVIEDNVWLGTGVVVLPGVRIGNGSIISANSVVHKDVPSMVVAGGNPLKIIKTNK